MATEPPQVALPNDRSSQRATPAAAGKVNVALLQSSFISEGGESYDAKSALDDLPIVRMALQLFLESKMVESEQIINNRDPVK